METVNTKREIFFEDKKYEMKLIIEEGNNKLYEIDDICPILGATLSDIKEIFQDYNASDYSIGKTYIIENDGITKYYE